MLYLLSIERHLKRLKGEEVPEVYSFRIIDKDENIKWVEINSVKITWEGKPATLNFLSEITQRKQAEKEIRQLSQFQESIIDNANVWLDVLDAEANVVIWNKAAEEISGYSSEEVVGHDRIWEWLYPDEEYRNEITAQAAAIIEENEVVEDFETTIRCKDGQTRVISWNSRNLLDEDGNPIGSIALGRDITARKKAEEEKEEIQTQLLQAQKMESIGTLAGGVAHDFNNQLTVIGGNAQVAMMEVDESEPLYRSLKQINHAVTRSAKLTRQLLLFSRKETMEFETLSINQTINDLLKMLNRLIGEDITIQTELQSDVWTIQGDAGNIEQVITNIVVNARDAMPEGGKITIKTQNVTLNKEECKFMPDAEPGKYVRLSIEDTGEGLPNSFRKNV